MTSTGTQTKVTLGLSNFVFFAKVDYQNKRRSEARIGLDFIDKRCMKVHPRVVGYDSVGFTVGESKLEFGGSETSHNEYGFSGKNTFYKRIILALPAFHIIDSALLSFILRSTSLSQLAIFTVEHALSETWKARGLKSSGGIFKS